MHKTTYKMSQNRAYQLGRNRTSSGRFNAGVPVSNIFLWARCSSGTRNFVVADLRLFI